MKFRYEGHDKMGRPLKGELEAANQESASSELRAREIFALKLEPVTEDQMMTVLEHPEPPDVEAEIEKVRADADEEMPPCPADAHCPVCLDAEQSRWDAELTDDLRAAVEISNQIDNEMGALAIAMSKAALKEMVTEAACKAFNRAHVRRIDIRRARMMKDSRMPNGGPRRCP